MPRRIHSDYLARRSGLYCKRLLPGVVFLFSIMPLPALAFEWKNFWSTAEQRAKRQLNTQEYDELVGDAPNESWRGVGQYRQGDYQSASESFAKQHQEAVERGSDTEATSANYNRANAEVLSENYESALSLYDEVLESVPDHASALHNRAIAEQLLEQQQQQQQQQQQEGQQGEQGEQEQSDQQSGQSESQQADDQQEQKGEQSSNPGSESQSDQNSSEGEQSSEEQSDQEEQAAAERAMQAEQQQEGENENNNPQQSGQGATEPMTEREQANEQWLRQIPDDPAGLLQRKLENRHMTDYPTVKDSAKPW